MPTAARKITNFLYGWRGVWLPPVVLALLLFGALVFLSQSPHSTQTLYRLF